MVHGTYYIDFKKEIAVQYCSPRLVPRMEWNGFGYVFHTQNRIGTRLVPRIQQQLKYMHEAGSFPSHT